MAWSAAPCEHPRGRGRARRLLHVPRHEVWVGVPTPGTEVPERVDAHRVALRGRGPRVEAATARRRRPGPVHDPTLLAFLRTVSRALGRPGCTTVGRAGPGRAVPLPDARRCSHGMPAARRPPRVHAGAGRCCYDTMTLVGPGTWEAARAAVDVALTAVDLVAAGERSAYALCRPPGHHVTRRVRRLLLPQQRRRRPRRRCATPATSGSAVVDIDAHHGNGTQALFWDRADVAYGSLHVDPGAGWFPHYAGYADETGRGPGAGANPQPPARPRAPATTPGLDGGGGARRLGGRARCTALVVSLGVDAAGGRPREPAAGDRRRLPTGRRRLGELGLPTVAVQEGGYHLDTLGGLVAVTLRGLATRG